MPNAAPVIGNLDGDTISYAEDGPVVRLDLGANAVVSDIDSANFDGGTLTVSYNRQAGDLLSFSGTAAPGASQTVVVGGTTIGTYAQTAGGGLQITFNSSASATSVQEVFRSLTFQTTSNTPVEGTRTFTYSLVDGDGTADGGSDTATAISTVSVAANNDPPDATNSSFQMDENQAITFNNIDFRYSDVDGPGFGGVVITTLPTNGTIFYHGTAISAGQFIPADDLQNANYQPAAEQGGFPYTSFTYQVRDSAGATDPTPNTMTVNVRAENDLPYLVNFGGPSDPVQVTENLGGFSIDPGLDAVVVDPDTSVFANGGLRLLPIGNSGLIYNFDVSAGGGITVTTQEVGGEIQYNGVTFGTIIRDDHTYNVTPGGFVVGFNSNATQEAVSALVRHVTIAIDGGTSGTYEFQAELKDGVGDIYQNIGYGGRNTPWYVTYTAQNDTPVLAGLDDLVVFTPSAATSGPQILDPDVVFSDEEVADFQGGTLILSGASASDTLSIKPDGNLGVSGSNVTYFGNVFGTFSGGTGGTPLTVTFSGTFAHSGSIDELIQHLAFQTSNGGNSTRELTLTVTDSGGASATDTIIVQVGTGSQPSTGDDYLVGTSGNDYIDAQAGNDTVKGLDGDDVLIGGAGADSLDGGAGSDTYYVDNPADVVIDPAAPGVDRVATTVSYNLPGAADIEVFEVANSTSTDNLALGGNNFGQTIVGNAGNNVINGGGGDDTLVGLAGDDTLIGSPGNDTMYGGTGNDVYFVDAAGDRVYESPGEGSDRVATNVSYALTSDASIEVFETGQLSSTAALNLTGSSAGQYVIGNSGNNVINGGGGNDWLIGYDGNDTLIGTYSANTLEGGRGDDVYFVFDSADYIYERSGEGNDRVSVATSYSLAASAEVETLETNSVSGLSNFNLTGNLFAQLIVGNDGANVLDGKGGNDVLVGLGGGDRFTFSTELGPNNVDRIDGFQSGSDKIALDNGIFAGIGGLALTSGAFTTGSQAADADDRIIYDTATGALYYDADGTGAIGQVQFATLDGHPALAGSDFILV